MIKLGEEQEDALVKMKEFISSDELCFSLQGYAGTGKSTIIKQITEHLDDMYKEVVLCAPTHKAKLVLENFTEREAITLHKLLSLSPNIEIFELDFNDLIFVTNKNPLMFPFGGVVICDEASMINDHLFDLLTQKAKSFNSKIIFAGDKAQLRPVNSKYYSKVFNLPNSFTLTHIYRQVTDSGLSGVLPTLRTDYIPRFQNFIGENGSFICHTSTLEFFKQAIPFFQKAITNGDILETKMLAYTNNRVNALNSKIREILFKNDNEYNKSEFLTGFENFEFGGQKLWNSMDYVITEEPIKRDINIPFFLTVPAYNLSLYDSTAHDILNVSIISREVEEHYMTSLASIIERIRTEAVEMKRNRSRGASLRWKDYYKITGSFATPVDLYFDNRLIKKKSFGYGYAMTVHKSQGSSINNVFIDMKDVSICRDKEELRQLQYVGVSRTKTNCYILQ